jgi:branched-chain amino acid transport system permease protein
LSNVLTPTPAPTVTTVGARRPRPRRMITAVVGLVLFGAGFLVPQVVTDAYTQSLLVNGILLGIVALAVGFLIDQLGLVSFGIGAFYGMAAYAFTVAVTNWQWSPPAAAVFAIVATSAVSALIGALIVRLHVIAFLMVTLALTQMCFQIIQLQALRPYLGGDDGVLVEFDGTLFGLPQSDFLTSATFWPFLWVVTAVVVLAVHLVRSGRFGAKLRGIRENEERMRYSGFGTYWPRVGAFVLASGIAATAGVLHALSKGFVTPDIVSFTFAGNTLISAFVGGVGMLLGPVLGALIFTFAQSALSTSGNLPLFMGIAIALVVVFVPGGIAGSLARLVTRLRRRPKGNPDA